MWKGNYSSILLLLKAFCLFADWLVFETEYPKSQGGQSVAHYLAKVTLKSWIDFPAFTFPVPRLQVCTATFSSGQAFVCTCSHCVHGALGSIPEQGPSSAIAPHLWNLFIWLKSLVSALTVQRQEDFCEFRASWGYIMQPSLIKETIKILKAHLKQASISLFSRVRGIGQW